MLQASRGSLLRSCAFTQSSFFYLNMLFTCGCENHTKIKLVNIVNSHVIHIHSLNGQKI